MRRICTVIGVVVTSILLAPLIVPIFQPWSEINCEHQEINIKTGQSRYSRSLWFIRISERIEDTILSLALQGEIVDVSDIEAWHRVNTFSPGLHHSPHYAFHGAFAQAHEVGMLRDMYKLDSASTRDIARQVLVEWQANRSYFAAGKYLRKKMMELEESRKTSSTVPSEPTVADVQ